MKQNGKYSSQKTRNVRKMQRLENTTSFATSDSFPSPRLQNDPWTWGAPKHLRRELRRRELLRKRRHGDCFFCLTGDNGRSFIARVWLCQNVPPLRDCSEEAFKKHPETLMMKLDVCLNWNFGHFFGGACAFLNQKNLSLSGSRFNGSTPQYFLNVVHVESEGSIKTTIPLTCQPWGYPLEV